jgi:hypothetical protein
MSEENREASSWAAWKDSSADLSLELVIAWHSRRGHDVRKRGHTPIHAHGIGIGNLTPRTPDPSVLASHSQLGRMDDDAFPGVRGVSPKAARLCHVSHHSRTRTRPNWNSPLGPLDSAASESCAMPIPAIPGTCLRAESVLTGAE